MTFGNFGSGPGSVESILAMRSLAKNQAQADGDVKSIAEIYREAGLSRMWEGENGEIAGMERIFEHWRDLDHREPTLKIVCPYDHSRKKFGLFSRGSQIFFGS